MVDAPHTTLTKVVPVTEESLALASKTLHAGKLVSFSTETVYGLGANALNADACRSIFTTKGRPLTDPLIVHVHSMEKAQGLISHENERISTIFKELGSKLWPGPLTLVTKANLDVIPSLITAETGFVGIRIPNHPVAKALLEKSDLPIAAPSANKFGHVSPTKAEHVYHDFHKDSEVLILDGGQCSFGIESTVVKISETQLTILRKGGVSHQKLEQHCEGLGLEIVSLTQQQATKPEDNNCEAPGQFLRHYSPDIDSFLFKGETSLPMANAVLMDFGSRFASLESQVKCYRDLSPKGDCAEAINNVYDMLRWAETNTECTHVLIADLSEQLDKAEHMAALFDRLYRATSGKAAPL